MCIKMMYNITTFKNVADIKQQSSTGQNHTNLNIMATSSLDLNQKAKKRWQPV